MNTPNVEFLLTVPSVLRYNELVVVGTKDSYKIYIGNSKNRPVILVPEIPEAVALIESVTYSELTALIASSELVPAQKYLLTDYASVHIIPNTTDTNTPTAEPLLVTALSTNNLEPIAFSLSFPQDVIYYDVENDQNMVAGCTKGYIYRRIDTEKNIDMGFDWRSAKFRRWQLEHNSEDTTGAVANYTTGNVVKKTGTVELYIKLNDAEGKSFTDTSAWRRYEWDNLMYVSPFESWWTIVDDSFQIAIKTSTLYKDYSVFTTAPTIDGVQSAYNTIYNFAVQQNPNNLINDSNTVLFGLYINNNSIGTGFTNISIGNYFYHNTIGSNFYNNTIGNAFYGNIIGNDFNNNSIGSNFNGNTIGNGYKHNSIGNYFYNNSIGNGFNNNSIGSNFYNNTIGNDFNGNSIGDNFYSISIGNYFYGNTIGNIFSNNTIGNAFYGNIIGNGFNNNSIGNDFSSNTIGGYFNKNSIGNYFNSNTIADECYSNTIGNGFDVNTIGTGFKHNITKNPINAIDFTIATHVYEAYTTELIKASTGDIKLVYHNGISYLTVAPTA